MKLKCNFLGLSNASFSRGASRKSLGRDPGNLWKTLAIRSELSKTPLVMEKDWVLAITEFNR